MEETKKAPVKFAYGQVKANIWTNEKEGKDGKFEVQTVKLQKSYKDGEEWKDTQTLQKNDIQKAIMALQDAQKYLFGSGNKDGEQQ